MEFLKDHRFNVLLALIVLCTTPQSVLARMYKWVDEDGNTHYTQSPPPGDIQAEEINPPPEVDTEAAQKQLEAQRKQADKLQTDREKRAELAEKEKKIAAEKEARCQAAKASQASFERPRVNYVDDDGSRRIMGEEERLAGLARAKEQVKEACN